jgi:hypothetical protein
MVGWLIGGGGAIRPFGISRTVRRNRSIIRARCAHSLSVINVKIGGENRISVNISVGGVASAKRGGAGGNRE